MTGMSAHQRVWHARDNPEVPQYTPAFFSKPVSEERSITPALFRAVSLHLQTRSYNNEDMRARRDAPSDPHRLAAAEFIAWNAYTCSSDEGSQRYRCERETVENVGGAVDGARDASWITYTQLVDRNSHVRNRDADFQERQQWGKLVKFLEFNWEGEELHVAVVQSHKERPWYAGVAEVPQQVMGVDIGANNGLQVLDISGLDAVVGRVPRLVYGARKRKRTLVSEKTVVFDPSMGKNRA